MTGDFRGPVTGAAGTRDFEPDGVAFWGLVCRRRRASSVPISSPKQKRRAVTLPYLWDPKSQRIPETILPIGRRHLETTRCEAVPIS